MRTINQIDPIPKVGIPMAEFKNDPFILNELEKMLEEYGPLQFDSDFSRIESTMHEMTERSPIPKVLMPIIELR